MVGSCVQVTVRKGDSIGVFLKAVREQLAPQFRELRAVSVDNMMYIKVGGGGRAAAQAGTHAAGLAAMTPVVSQALAYDVIKALMSCSIVSAVHVCVGAASCYGSACSMVRLSVQAAALPSSPLPACLLACCHHYVPACLAWVTAAPCRRT